jgi:3-oxoadipate enol-lactonase
MADKSNRRHAPSEDSRPVTDHILELDDLRIAYRDEGPKDGPVLVLSHALGTDLSLWDGLVPLLPKSLRVLRYDHRGHGASSIPKAPYGMGALIHDAERLLDSLSLRDTVFLGLSLGGMVAQGLATKRLDLVRGMVLSNTAARISTAAIWQDRIRTVQSEGVEPLVPATMERWFAPRFRQSPKAQHWRAKLSATPPEGWAGCAAAIAGTDFYTTTAALTLPTLAIAGTDDGTTPPDLVRETADLIKGSRFALIRGAGHLPLIEQPQTYADLVSGFLESIGHV